MFSPLLDNSNMGVGGVISNQWLKKQEKKKRKKKVFNQYIVNTIKSILGCSIQVTCKMLQKLF